ncbi:CRISPR-associated helicase Cas3' [Spirulina sp. CCNP1310]|uniref:CRISPR-associated helicase Cas3' n=1 Tax=Spirulina sp. CCNP1310 TaxID=3110249 RepID=UPI002B2157C9|nr:CRISPR-associated helicase Cas3' [Spirulina sp. CCNP1310]MEA5419873.1 CRISPR-associated helicase Cas3' [Spirulina sp. CCNP1310]
MVIAAHTPNPNDPEQKWHPLQAHLTKVAHKAAAFAAVMGGERCGYYAGLWHDLGKYHPAFQAYLQACHGGDRTQSVPHAIHGAKLAAKQFQPLALLIYGHHSGLPAFDTLKVKLTGRNPEQTETAYQTVIEQAKAAGIDLKASPMLRQEMAAHQHNSLQCELFLRLLFSCLIDADHLDTEEHFNPEKAAQRKISLPLQSVDSNDVAREENLLTLPQFKAELEREQKLFEQNLLLNTVPNTLVNQVRHEVYQFCCAQALHKPGVFRLCVPTGGGKTRSGLAFALNHACQHGQRRVIFAVPYTSIIEQTVDVYRKIFASLGEMAVLEHHSAISPESLKGLKEDWRDDDARSAYAQARLIAQNWDAPLIVTTTVQLFDSLFSNRPGRCRKLHNLVNSVIVLDEVQTLPIPLLEPILDVLRQLVQNYGVTVVLCTATQPAFEGSTPYLAGFEKITDIVPPLEAQRHFQALQRVDYIRPQKPWSWSDLSADLQQRSAEQALIIVNTRKDALAALAALQAAEFPAEGLFQLSTLLCGAHRSQILKMVKERLERGLPCWLVSTQVVEAGVDLDFPVVYRAIAPLDRIVQAAGRCNREGKRDRGQVILFEPLEGGSPRGLYQTAYEVAKKYLSPEEIEQLHRPDIFVRYFQELYQQADLSPGQEIQKERKKLNYPEVAKFSLIEDETIPVVVNYGESGKILQKVRAQGRVGRELYSRLQSYVVNLFPWQFNQSEESRQEVVPGLWEWRGGYDQLVGIEWEGQPIQRDPYDLIV